MYKRKIGGICRFEDNFGVFLTFFHRFCLLYGATEFEFKERFQFGRRRTKRRFIMNFDIMFIIFL